MKTLRVGVLALMAAFLATSPVVASADGICVCGMKRPLRVEQPAPVPTKLHIDTSNIWHRPL